jgi:spoIIIJ-associated protein
VEWVEVTGKSVEEAKDRALDRLGVDERDAEFEVLEEPRLGFLGRLKGEARVRARVSPKTPRAKADGRRRRRDGESKPRTRSPRAGAGVVDQPSPLPVATAVDAEQGPPVEDAAPRSPAGRRRRRPAADGGRRTDREVPETADEQKVTPMAELPLDEQAKIVARFMDGLLDAFGLTGTTTWHVIDDETAEVQVDGTDLGLLVGPKGRTLQALSDVARSVVVRHADGTPGGRVHLDVARYRERRREALIRFTNQIAAQVKESGTPVALEPMGAADRKTFHDAATEIEGVRSTSEGEDPNRRVVILPAS